MDKPNIHKKKDPTKPNTKKPNKKKNTKKSLPTKGRFQQVCCNGTVFGVRCPRVVDGALHMYSPKKPPSPGKIGRLHMPVLLLMDGNDIALSRAKSLSFNQCFARGLVLSIPLEPNG